MRTLRTIFFGSILALLQLPVLSQAQPRVESFTPLGLIKEPNQISVRFSQDMVSMGDPRVVSEIFESNCNNLGNGRWIDSRNWVLDLYKPLEGGKECRFTLKDSIRSLSGSSIVGERRFSFNTGGLMVQYTTPWIGGTVSEDQVFLFKLDGEPNIDSILKNVYIRKENSQDRVGFNLIEGSKREEYINLAYWSNLDKQTVVALSPKTLLPDTTKIQIVWSKDAQSKEGVKNQEDQILDFSVRPKFQASIYCQRESAQRHCLPLTDIELRFSASIASSELPSIFLQDSSGKKIFGTTGSESERGNSIDTVVFKAPFSEKSAFKVHIPSSLKDDAGRSLSNSKSFPMEVKTDRYTPLAKFSSPFGVLEWKASPILPVTIRNLEGVVSGRVLSIKPSEISAKTISKWMSLAHNTENTVSIFKNESQKPADLQVPKIMQDGSMEVVGIPLLKPGMYAVEIRSKILGQSLTGENKEFFVPTIALVTNLGVHFKWGKESSLVWVTELSSGKPVPRADVTIADCNGRVLSKGKTLNNGTFRVTGLPDKSNTPYCSWKSYENGLFVIANTEEDTSFLHSNWNQGIEAWRFNLPYSSFQDGQIIHTFLDRTLFRTGETVSMKHTVRKHSMKGFVSPDLSKIPTYILIKHEGSDTTYYKSVKWSFPGSSSMDWKIPKNAFLGTYTVHLATSEEDTWGIQKLGEFRVEEFRLPILRASVSSTKFTWVDEEKIPITMQASFLSGGQASGLPVSFRYKISPDSFQPKGWDSYSFSSSPVKTGRVSYDSQSATDKGYETMNITLNRDGMASTTVNWKNRTEVSLLRMEMEFRDPNGETQSVSSRIQLLPSTQYVGLGIENYSMNQETIRLDSVVVDSQGKPVPGASVEIHAFERQDYVHRKRLVGGFYSYDYYTDVRPLGRICEGKTDNKGQFLCSPKNFNKTGDILFEARSKDSKGGVSFANRTAWIADKNDWWYSASDTDRMDLVPDKKRYVSGDTAKIRVEAPFSEYSALITVEREGVLRNYVRDVNGKDPYVEIPIEKEFAPNVFVSVLAIRGRVGNPKETALVDLAKPSYRLGIKEIKVGWDPYELKVDVKPDKSEYQVRSKGQVKVSVMNSGKKVGGGEVAIAIVDEALLELSGNSTADILATMMGTRGIEVDSHTLQMQVVGKRHFGKKAVPAGGGGGNQPTRELMDTLLYWNPEVRLDGNGEAIIPFQLKDALTGYRVLAVATSGTELFGKGEGRFTATQDILLFSGLPPVVRTGDRFFQEYTLKNNTSSQKTLTLSLGAEGTNGKESFPDQTVTIESGESKKVSWEALVGGKSGERASTVQVALGGKTIDSLKVIQKIEDSIPVRITQGTVLRLDENSMEVPISLPQDGISGRGGVNATLASTILSSTQGIQSYMREYPFTCMEQRFSKAVVSEIPAERDIVLNDLSSHLDTDGLLKYFPNSTWGDEILTASILTLAKEAGWSIPQSTLDKITTGLNRFLDGTLVRQRQYNFNDSIFRRILVLEALSKYNSIAPRLSGMNPDVSVLPNSTLIQWISILKKETSVQSRNELLKKAEDNLRGRMNFQGTEMVLRDNQGDLWWLMGNSELDSARFLSYAIESPAYKQDMARLILGFTSRMKKGRFSTTLSNSFGYLAMKKFANTFEKEKVTGNTKASLGSMERDVNWANLSGSKVSKQQFPMNESKEARLKLEHSGQGKPWVFVSTEAAIPLKENLDNGIRVRKKLNPVYQKSSGRWSVGDVVNVKIEWEISASRTWVVVLDPIPTGASILGSGLGRDSESQASSNFSDSNYFLSFQERGFSSYRAYYEYLPEGKYSVDYNLRINQEGKFTLPPTRMEAMYSPDIYGETPNPEWIVLP